MEHVRLIPGQVVPETGVYQLFDAVGMPTLARVPVFEGATVPPAPDGWSWQRDSKSALPPD